jgi:Ca-activated chloride channel family protein
MSKAHNSEGTGLTTIGLGTDFNAQLMRALAQEGDGNFYFLENAAAVSEVFTEELSYFTVPVALDVKLELAAGSQYVFNRAYGSSKWAATPNGGSLLIPSVFLAHRKSHADQTSAGGRRGGGSALLVELMPRSTVDDGSGTLRAEIGTVTVTFREPGTNRMVTERITVGHPNPPWFAPETGYFDARDAAIVQKSFVMLNIYMGIEEACRNFHIGDRRMILGRLRRLLAAVDDYNEEIADRDIAADRALLVQLTDVLRRNGVVDPAEVRVPANPWPVD